MKIVDYKRDLTDNRRTDTSSTVSTCFLCVNKSGSERGQKSAALVLFKITKSLSLAVGEWLRAVPDSHKMPDAEKACAGRKGEAQ